MEYILGTWIEWYDDARVMANIEVSTRVRASRGHHANGQLSPSLQSLGVEGPLNLSQGFARGIIAKERARRRSVTAVNDSVGSKSLALSSIRGYNLLIDLAGASRLPFKLQDIVEELIIEEAKVEEQKQKQQVQVEPKVEKVALPTAFIIKLEVTPLVQ